VNPPKQSGFSKILIIVIVVGVLVIGGVVWYYQKTVQIISQPAPQISPTNETASWQTYRNEEYGFEVTLADDWQGYSVNTTTIQYGWLVTIRHPQWSETNQRMDIPILVYPLEQWNKWVAENFASYPTAAPIGPTERGRNNRYVFATAPRYNYSFATGWEEVENIIKTLQGF